MTDTISDMLSRIRNAARAMRADVEVAHSVLKERLAAVLKREGYISDWQVHGQGKKTIRLRLKYQGRRPVISGLKRVSTPGLRRYISAKAVPRVVGAMGTAILTTPKGVLTGVEARKLNTGGELMCQVW